jgi:hypothetical protein
MQALHPPNSDQRPGPSRSDRWVPSSRSDVSIRRDKDGILRFRLERDVEPSDIMTLAEAATFLRKSTQTLLNWRKKYPAFPIEKWGGQWVVIRPYLEAFLLHGYA